MGDILAERLEPDSKLSSTVVCTLVGSVLGFQCFNFALNFVPAPEKYAGEQRFKWRNVMTSFAHALITGTISIYCIVSYPELFNDMLHNTNLIAELQLAISGGYFIYDTYDLLATGKQWALIIHHVCIGGVFLSFLYHTFGVPCCVITLLIEVNGTFLHGRQLALMFGFAKSTVLFRAVNAVNIVTFVCLRFGVLLYFYAFMYNQRMIIPSVALWTVLPAWTVGSGINVVLFWRLLRADVFASKNGQEQDILVRD